MRFDNETILVSHGGNGISYLMEPVQYNYLDWESIGQMNLNIIVGANETVKSDEVSMAAGSGMTPEIMAITLLLTGPNQDPIEVFNKNIT